MSTEDLTRKLKEVNEEIEALQSKRAFLEKALMESSESFGDKFIVWMNSTSKNHEPWIISKDKYPLTRAWFDKHYDWDRHRTYDVLDYLQDDLYFLTDPEDYAEDIKENPERAYSEEHIAEYTALAKELMETNLGSFTCDW